MDVRVGLDFGTHQTKVCVNYQKKGQLPVFEFINFGEGNKHSFFLPSKVNVLENDLVSVGDELGAKSSYRYFKMASAEDKLFRGISGLNKNKDHYRQERYDSYTPEILSIIFLAHVIGMVQDKFEQAHKNTSKKVKNNSFLGRFFGKNEPAQTNSNKNYYYQIGIPTEWSEEKNLWRRRKFEQILYLAYDIIETHSYSFIKDLEMPALMKVLKQHHDTLADTLKDRSWDELVAGGNISAFPEAAAGLTYLVKTGKIPEGYYLTLDIGGGSSDISFFRVNSNRTFEYLASESLMIASNDVFDAYSEKLGCGRSTEEVQEYLDQQSHQDLIQNKIFADACRDTIQRLNKKIKRIYNHRVYRRFVKTVANTKFRNQSCYLYGGGSLLFDDKKGTRKFLEKILLHDQGTQSLTATRTHAVVDPLDDLDIPDIVKPDNWKEYLPLLIVPLGLSFIQPDKTYGWNADFYESGEGLYHIDDHPELFDIYKRKWV